MYLKAIRNNVICLNKSILFPWKPGAVLSPVLLLLPYFAIVSVDIAKKVRRISNHRPRTEWTRNNPGTYRADISYESQEWMVERLAKATNVDDDFQLGNRSCPIIFYFQLSPMTTAHRLTF